MRQPNISSDAATTRIGARYECAACGYDVHDLLGTSARCPECGGVLAIVGVVRADSRKSRVALWTVMLIGLVIFGITLTFISLTASTAATMKRDAAAASLMAETAARQRAEEAIHSAIEAAVEASLEAPTEAPIEAPVEANEGGASTERDTETGETPPIAEPASAPPR